MKKIITFSTLAALLILGNTYCAYSQAVGISGTGSVPDPSALLDVDATGMNPKKGLLMPRLTTTERDAIATGCSCTPAEGLMIFNTTTKCVEMYVNGAWNTGFCPAACMPPAAPVATAASAISSTSFTANWGSSSGATSYYIDVATDAGFTTFVSGYNNINVGNVTSASVTGLTAGTTYYYRLRATTTCVSANSNAITAVTSYPVVTGGTLASDATYYYRTFLASGTLGITGSLTCDVLVIAGGGGGGYDLSGGGGGGGLLYSPGQVFSTNQTVTVGAGGAGGTTGSGSVGSDSQFGSLTLVKGGGYGGYGANGGTGGSGGGSGRNGYTGGSATAGQGYAGGAGIYQYDCGGSGGGAGATGGARASGGAAPAGGVGLSTYSALGLATGTGQNVSGTVYYAGGGGVGGYLYANTGAYVGSAGGYGGGGANTSGAVGGTPGVNGNAGTANTGGGGAAGSAFGGNGGAGGSGIVIVRYTRAQVGG